MALTGGQMFKDIKKAYDTGAYKVPQAETPKANTNPLQQSNVNQSTYFAPINITPVSGNVSLFGGGANPNITITQKVSNQSETNQQYAYDVMNTITNATNISNQYSSNLSIVQGTGASGAISSPQSVTPSTTVTPTLSTSQSATQAQTASQSDAFDFGKMDWWQYLLIGGVALYLIYSFSKNKKSRNNNADLVKYIR